MRCRYVFIELLRYDRIPLDDKYIPKNYQINWIAGEQDGYRYTIYPLFPDASYEEWYTEVETTR